MKTASPSISPFPGICFASGQNYTQLQATPELRGFTTVPVQCSHTPRYFPLKAILPLILEKPTLHAGTEENSQGEGGHSTLKEILPLILEKSTLHAGTRGGWAQHPLSSPPQAVPRAGHRRCTPHPSSQGTPHVPAPCPRPPWQTNPRRKRSLKQQGYLSVRSRLPQSASHASPTCPGSTSRSRPGLL